MEFDPLNVRYELKMDCEREYLPVIRSWVIVNQAGFRTAYPARRVNSLYFDTYDLDAFNDHLEGIPERRKLRFRWYGADLKTASGTMELKCKRARVGWKRIAPVKVQVDLLKAWPDVLRQLRDGIQGEIKPMFLELLEVSRPVVINSYQREYFVSADGKIRLTLDYELIAYDQWLTPKPNIQFRQPQVDQLVVEFKCDVGDSEELSDVISGFPLRSTRHSKFVSALGAILER